MKSAMILTGVTSGFGAAALDIIVQKYDGEIIVGARSPDVISERYGDRVKGLPLDLASLQSVRDFCATLPSDVEIETLGMNAGLTAGKIVMTDDGFERCFQVNYLSHVLLFDLVQPNLATGARIVTTGSGTHDPEEKTPMPPPNHADAGKLAHPQSDPQRDKFNPRAGGRAYASSKLCCILMASEMARRFPSYHAASFDPGYLPDTNLMRDVPKPLASIAKRIVPLFMPNDRAGTTATTAPYYADVLMGTLSPDKNGGYLSVRGGDVETFQPSVLARDTSLGSKLWDDSRQLLLAKA